jgi:riboflavin kinase/FMN adenylyltransferase
MSAGSNAVRPSIVTVGTFDGVHRGHRLVLDRLAAAARGRELRAILVTFEPHPLAVVNPEAAPRLLSVGDEKMEALASTGLDEVAVVPFTRNLAAYEAEQFVDLVLIGRFGMRELFIGHDHGFGRGRSGDVAVLERLGRLRGFGVHVVPPVDGRDGLPVSSTGIRRAIAGGDLARAADGLGRPYSVAGTVRRGDARGARLGYRTINLGSPIPTKLLPPDGVYAIRAQTPGGRFGGMMNLGGRPTFGDATRTIEAHLFDIEGDWQGARVRLDFIAHLRGVRPFSSPDELIRQLALDEAAARVILGRNKAGL